MLGLEGMRFDLDERFSPLSNRRKSGKNEPLSIWWYPFLTDTGLICSLDMVRLKLKFLGDKTGAELDEKAATLPVLCDYNSWTAHVKPGGWRALHNFGFGDSSASLGIGWMGPSCSIDMAVGFLEFNPNKLGRIDGFVRLLFLLREYVSRADLVRYDLAVNLDVATTVTNA